MSYARAYAQCLVRGDYLGARALERDHGLYGYPPMLVSIGLKAIDDKRDPHEAIAEAFYATTKETPHG